MIEITSMQQFDKEVIQSQGIVVVDLWRNDCNPCKMLAPNFEKASKEAGGVFVKVNTDDLPEIPSMFGIMSVPTILVLKDGNLVNFRSGYMGVADIVDMVKGA